MNGVFDKEFPRRAVLKGAGALVIGFSLGEMAALQPAQALDIGPYGPPEDQVDSWISVGDDGLVTLFSGCCELGTGSSTGLLQVMAEELDVPLARTRLFGPDTSRTPDQYVSSGSRTIAFHARPIRQAAAEACAALVKLAAQALKLPVEQLITRDGFVMAADQPTNKITYAQLVGGRQFNLKVTGAIKPKAPKDYRLVGTSAPRIDIPDKVFGTFTYMQDVKVPGMLHGRMVRPPSHGASVVAIDESSVAHIPGLIKVVRVRDCVGVVCAREENAIAAAAALKVTWSEWSGLPAMKDLHGEIRKAPEYPQGYPKTAPGGVLANTGDAEAALGVAAKIVRAEYRTPYHHHGSIGPSCAVADWREDGLTLWSGAQAPFGLREACAKFAGLPNERVRLIYAEASGCYGQNGADDVTIDALILSRAVGKPVRVQWSRAEENGWETLKAARVSECQGGLDASGNIIAWDTRTFGFSGYARPAYHEPVHGGDPGSLVSAQLAGWPGPGLEEGFSGAAGNFVPVYDAMPNARVVFTYLGPTSHRRGAIRMRAGSMRGVGSPDNIYVAECFMDEMAAAAGMDAIEFRIKHKPKPRGLAVLRAAAERANWRTRVSHTDASGGDIATGRGVALLGGANDTNVAGIFEVAVNRKTGVVRVTRAIIAQDCGLVVNPDAVRNQIEGGVIQSISRALKEEVMFDRARITSLDWAGYPIIQFSEIPEAVEIVLLDRPDLPPMRVGEPASESVWPGVANAIYDALGVRLRQMPFTPERVLAALAGSA